MFRYAVIALALGLGVAVSASLGDTIYVGGSEPGNYPTIQAGIDAANPGDTVYVYDDSSPYYENVTIDKSISLVGENGDTTVIDGGTTGDVVVITASGVSVRAFTIRGSSPARYRAGLRVTQGCSNTSIIENIVSGLAYGIVLDRCNESVVGGNLIAGSLLDGIELFLSSADAVVANNISVSADGIHVDRASGSTIAGNTVTGHLYMSQATNCTVYHNNFTENSAYSYGYGCTGTWDAGYPGGGNYWSGHQGADLCHGPDQTFPGQDGVADSQHVLAGGPVDHYPLMAPCYPPALPFPPDGAVAVAPGSTISWIGKEPYAGDTATYDVYFGTDNPPPLVSQSQSGTQYDPGGLLTEATYYWQVVLWNDGSPTAGPIWSFTASSHAPYAPYGPSPADGATPVLPKVDLTWKGGDVDFGDTVTYDVYFGTSTPPPMVSPSQTPTSYDPGWLEFGTTYYWQVVATDGTGQSASGPIWTFGTCPLSGSIRNVGGGSEPYPTIQAAIDAADNGDAILVHHDSSPYFEHVVVSKQVMLVGESRATTVIDGGGAGIVVYVPEAPQVTVARFTIQNGDVGVQINPPCGEDPWYCCGMTGRSTGNTISNNTIVGTSCGVAMYGVDYTLEGNSVIGNEIDGGGIYVGDAGIWLESGEHDDWDYPAAQNLISDNSIGDWSYALVLTGHTYDYQPGDRNQILNNVLSASYYAIFVGGTDYGEQTYRNTIQGNLVIACHVGMFFGYPYDFSTGSNTIADNTFDSPDSWLDIYIRSGRNTITGNHLSRMESELSYANQVLNNTIDESLSFYVSESNHFIGNTFAGCRVTFVEGGANHAYHNNFLGATLTFNEGVAWDNGYPSGGNYWSDYTGIDLYHGSGQNVPGADGIGDTAQGLDRYPFMEPGGWGLNHPPYPPYYPVPADGAAGVDLNVDLVWSAGDPDAGDVATYDVYFGTATPPALVSGGQTAATYDPGLLAVDTTYYWQVVAWDEHGLSSSGPVWSFLTLLPGDVDGDRDVDYDDYIAFVAAYGHSTGEPGFNAYADLDHDGLVSLVDYQLWRQAYGAFVGDANAPLPTRPGDLNVDGTVSSADINPFVLALRDAAAYHAQYSWGNINNADINTDGRIDFGDINPFVDLLVR